MPDVRSLLVRYAALWLVPLAVLVALVAAEGILRLFPALLPEEAQVRLQYQLREAVQSIGDPDLGFLYPSHQRKQIVTADFSFEIETDDHGFRNPAPWPARADVVVVGDSMAFGWGVERSASWVYLLEQGLAGRRVITLGLPGTAPQQYYRYLEKFGVGLRPEVVVFAVFPGNDFVGAEQFDQWLQAGSPGNFDVWRAFDGEVPVQPKDALGPSYLRLFLWGLGRRTDEPFAGRSVRLSDGSRLQLVPGIFRRAVALNDPTTPSFQAVVDATLAARDLAQTNGSRFLVVLFPTKEAVYLPLFGQPFTSLTRPLADVLKEHGVECINLVGPFRERAAQGQKLYFEIDGHPNELGNQLVAEVVGEHLRKWVAQP